MAVKFPNKIIMNNIKLLDCTLRDGGYINDWRFGIDAIKNIENLIINSNIDIFEIGFLKDETYTQERTVFNSVKQISDIIKPKKDSVSYACMIEAAIDPFPLNKLDRWSEGSVDIIRAMVWKRLLHEGFDYCKSIIDKGYKLCVQPVRVDQYTHKEFTDMIELFNKIDPMAVYVVDSWGTQNKKSLMEYLKIAHKNLKPGIALGYHGHNNLMQAFGVAESFIEYGFERDIIIDGSVYGIGRGAGNLNIELFVQYLNDNYAKDYKTVPLLAVYEQYLKPLYIKSPWGYSLPLYLTAIYNCNPEYATYYGQELGLDVLSINNILNIISTDDKVQFKKETADLYLTEYQAKVGL
ncbi:hypothetical protein FACS189483_01960 [Spirochaetia bacterium]|nr:hypothetical protein FACS189483_01960 [Spirochaetia bacterium]